VDDSNVDDCAVEAVLSFNELISACSECSDADVCELDSDDKVEADVETFAGTSGKGSDANDGATVDVDEDEVEAAALVMTKHSDVFEASLWIISDILMRT